MSHHTVKPILPLGRAWCHLKGRRSSLIFRLIGKFQLTATLQIPGVALSLATGVEGVEQASESSTALLKSSSSSKAVKGRLKTYFNRLIYSR